MLCVEMARVWAVANNETEHTTMKPVTVKLTKTKDCKGSVRFDAPKTQPGQPPNPIDNAYVNRSVPGINEAQQITVTIEVP